MKKRVLSALVICTSLMMSSPVWGQMKTPVVTTIEAVLAKANQGRIHQVFIVMTGPDGMSYSYSVSNEAQLSLVGGIEWAKAELLTKFSKENAEKTQTETK